MTRQLGSFFAAALLAALPLAAQAAGDPAAGKAKFDLFCASCHGAGGMGDGPAAPKDPSPRDFTKGAFKYDADKDGKPGSDADLDLDHQERRGRLRREPADGRLGRRTPGSGRPEPDRLRPHPEEVTDRTGRADAARSVSAPRSATLEPLRGRVPA